MAWQRQRGSGDGAASSSLSLSLLPSFSLSFSPSFFNECEGPLIRGASSLLYAANSPIAL